MKPPRAMGNAKTNPSASVGRTEDHGGGNGTVGMSRFGSIASTQRPSTKARSSDALRIIATAGPKARREPPSRPATMPNKKRTPQANSNPIFTLCSVRLTHCRSAASGESPTRSDGPIPGHNIGSARRLQRPLAIMLRFRYVSTALRDSPPLPGTLKLPAFVATRRVEDLKSAFATEIDGKIS
jgi:hypothetical protein